MPENLSRLDLQLSLFEPLLAETGGPWIFSTSTPSLADISIYYQLLWGEDISSGRYSDNISEGEVQNDTPGEVISEVFNSERYPAVVTWYRRMRAYFEELPSTEKKLNIEQVLDEMKRSPSLGPRSLLLPTPSSAHTGLNEKIGLQEGALVSVVPDDTGRDE